MKDARIKCHSMEKIFNELVMMKYSIIKKILLPELLQHSKSANSKPAKSHQPKKAPVDPKNPFNLPKLFGELAWQFLLYLATDTLHAENVWRYQNENNFSSIHV